jgi:mannosyltransferase
VTTSPTSPRAPADPCGSDTPTHDIPVIGALAPAPSPAFRISLIGLTLLAAVTGSFRLGRQPIWFDEAFSVMFAHQDWYGFWELAWAAELNMVLHYLLLRNWTVAFGMSEASLRSLSVLTVAAAVPLLMLLGRRLFGERCGLICGALAATNGPLLMFAQETRAYALTVTLVIAAALCLVTAVHQEAATQRRAGRWWAGFAIAGALSVYAHLYAALILVALGVSLLALPPGVLRRRQAIPAFLGLGILCGPMVAFATQARTDQIAWIGGQLDDALPRTLYFLAGNASMGMRGIATLGLLALLASWLRRGALRGYRTLESWSYAIVAAWLTVPLILALALSEALLPILVPRYLVVVVPAVLLGLSAVLRLLTNGWAIAAATAAVITLQAPALVELYTHDRSESWRDLAEAVMDEAEAGDGLIVIPGWQRMPLEYYLAVHPVTSRSADDLPTPIMPAEAWGSTPMYGGTELPATAVDLARPAIWLVLDGDASRPGRAEFETALAPLRLASERSYGELTLRRYEQSP